MSKSIGKRFEENWKNSCPDWLFTYRPPDAAQSFDMSTTLRFSSRSPCDFMHFDGNHGRFYTLELKTSADNFSFERSKNDKGMIHSYQIHTLQDFARYLNVISGFILDFRKSNNTYFVEINDFNQMIKRLTKKSFNERDLLEYCYPTLISKKKLKVNYRYDVEKFINDFNIKTEKTEETNC